MARQSRGLYVAILLRFFVLMFAIVVVMKMYVGWEFPTSASPPEFPAATDQPKIHTVSFPFAVRVGDLTVPAGVYRVRHVASVNLHVMVFSLTSDAATYRVRCRPEMLPDRAKSTQQQYELDSSGQKRLAALTFEGEWVRHIF
jgi:hypothetical protein